MYLLDTNIISELRRPRPHPSLITWLSGLASDQIFISAVTLGELQAGVENIRQQDTGRAEIIERWIDSVAASYSVLPMDGGAFRCWAKLMHGKPADLIADAMIAATAVVRNLTVVTRNLSDFERLGVPAFDPFIELVCRPFAVSLRFLPRSVRQHSETQLGRYRSQAPIVRPQFAVPGQQRGRQQVGIDIADAAPEQRMTIDQAEHFLVLGNDRLRQVAQVAEKGIPRSQIAEREFADHKRVSEDLASVEERRELLIACVQMLDPDRCIDQDHSGFGRRRGIGLRSGWLPPRRASRRAASRSTRPQRHAISADFAYAV
jgi:predicted nucleic acid-binding protein